MHLKYSSLPTLGHHYPVWHNHLYNIFQQNVHYNSFISNTLAEISALNFSITSKLNIELIKKKDDEAMAAFYWKNVKMD